MKNFWISLGIVVVIVAVGVAYKSTRDEGQGVSTPAKPTAVADISRRADDIPPPIKRKKSETVVVELETKEVVAELAQGVTYEYWTYNGTVPGPFIRAREGDTVEVRLTHAHGGDDHHSAGELPHTISIDALASNVAYADDGHAHEEMMDAHGTGGSANAGAGGHDEAGHGAHSIDLHAVEGPGGGSTLTQTSPGETRTFQFKAIRPGLYVYHCASPHIPTHIANGMYGLILVEPEEGLSEVDREYYVMQGEVYTKGTVGEKGHQEFSLEKLLAERPEYFVFNGKVGALTGERALKAEAGETIRIFFGVGTHIASNFHVIGGILDKLYPEGDIVSPPHRNVQTTIVPPGGAMMTEFTLEVPGKYLLVDHSLTRATDRGALGEIIVEGPERPEIFREVR